MQWMMLQQDHPEDFVIATGTQYSVRQFIEWAAEELGVVITWSGEGVEETGRIAPNSPVLQAAGCLLKADQIILRIDPRYFRPAEVETLLGDPSKACEKLGWVPEITIQEMCKEMVQHDLARTRQ